MVSAIVVDNSRSRNIKPLNYWFMVFTAYITKKHSLPSKSFIWVKVNKEADCYRK
jgi:hypothetical protein